MAVVYLATLRGAGGFEKRLVVKQIRAELASDAAFVERFVAEAKTTVGLSHPNIVPVYELGVEQGVYFIAMELAQGVTLADLLKLSGRLSPEEGAYLGVEISRALDYAHRKAGVVHRDVTPRNVLIDDEGAVRLIDFGIAAPVSEEGAARERVFGSPGHMPPEQTKGGRLTPATDVFAVGALLLEAWTNEAPFRRKTRAESEAALEVPPPPPSRVDPALSPLDELLARAVALAPEARPQTPEDLARPLREFLRTADLGDIARRLGARVRRVKRESKASVHPDSGALAGAPGGTRPMAPSTPSTRPLTPATPATPASPSTKAGTDPATHTFAARDEVSEWTRPLSVPPSAPPPPPLPPPAPPERKGRRAAIVLVSLAGAAAFGAVVALETDRVPQEALPAVGTAGSVATDTPKAAAPALPAAGPSATAVPPIAAESGLRPVGAEIRAPATRDTAPAASLPSAAGLPPVGASAVGVPSAPSAATEDHADATFTFTSDLPARVSMDGTSLGSTPIRGLKRAPGRHLVTISGLSLDERLSATVSAAPAQSVSVHAEFTRAVPTLRVH